MDATQVIVEENLGNCIEQNIQMSTNNTLVVRDDENREVFETLKTMKRQ